MYIHECAPAHLRGVVFSLYQVMLSVGSITGACVDLGTREMHGRKAYQIPLAMFFIAPTIQSIASIWAPESPRWLMSQGKEEASEKALRTLRGNAIDEHQFQAELSEIRESTREQVKANTGFLFMEMWRGTNLRRTLLCFAVVCFHCANGIVPQVYQLIIANYGQVLLGLLTTLLTSSRRPVLGTHLATRFY